MSSDSNASSSSDESADHIKPNADRNIGSIDHSLDAIETQLTSIALNQPQDSLIESESESESESEAEAEANSSTDEVPVLEIANVSLKEEIITVPEVEIEGEESRERNLIPESSNNSEREMDGLSSPSSSGYAGERGSSSGATSASGTDEVPDAQDNGASSSVDGMLDSTLQQPQWVPGKRHVDEVS